MGSYPLPALQGRNPEFPGFMDRKRQGLQVKNLMQRQQLGEMQLDEAAQRKAAAQQEAALGQQVDSILANSNGDWESVLPEIQKISPQQYMEYSDWISKFNEQGFKEKKAETEEALANLSAVGQLAQSVTDAASHQAAVQRGLQMGILTPEQAQAELQAGYDPERVEAMRLSALTTKQFYDREDKKLTREATAEHRQAQLDKPTTKEQDWRSYWAVRKKELQAEGVKINGKVERIERDRYAARGERGPSKTGAQVAVRRRASAISKATSDYRKKLAAREKNWLRSDTGTGWYHEDTYEEITNAEYERLAKQYREEFEDDKRRAYDAYEDELLAGGHEIPGGARGASAAALSAHGPAAGAYREGQVLVNPQTGAKVVLRGNQWVPAP